MHCPLYSLIALVLLVSGCSESPIPTDPVSDDPAKLRGSWLLVRIDGETAPLSNSRETNRHTKIRFDADSAGSIDGVAAVNGYFGRYQASTGTIQCEELSVQLEYGWPSDNEFEDRYLAALGTVTRFEVRDHATEDVLVLYYPNGSLEYKAE